MCLCLCCHLTHLGIGGRTGGEKGGKGEGEVRGERGRERGMGGGEKEGMASNELTSHTVHNEPYLPLKSLFIFSSYFCFSLFPPSLSPSLSILSIIEREMVRYLD